MKNVLPTWAVTAVYCKIPLLYGQALEGELTPFRLTSVSVIFQPYLYSYSHTPYLANLLLFQ